MIYHSTHPLIKHLVNSIRDISIDAQRMREYIGTIAQFLLFEALRNQQLVPKTISTWIGSKEFGFLDEENFVFIPILRAGIPMMEGVLPLFPKAKAGFLAMKRDESTFEPIVYYKRFPKLENKTVFLCDPMVATGGSLHDAIKIVGKENPAKIITLNIVGVQEGLEYAQSANENVDIYIAQIDDHLNDKKYIIPGLGDAGDRAYNTEEE
ncbi:uracil phosphoribosyltransferase [Nitratiruptor sp. SB155-2]|uniref:uracil phosphoribosyltransferase n=1 Tax=Nitratiruptor sp. (strain SB155-2) TaxID=387092 RepID=UPI00015870D0|nr:uracil phosphoribosyltransferase [Nitratiruptor sp. SB155-2]BAF70869.1 uracil phosphoribosyltransferase [Nitratiruptor sp. SB155-2]